LRQAFFRWPLGTFTFARGCVGTTMIDTILLSGATVLLLGYLLYALLMPEKF
jgi:K+-transporting ATPase KdpF subunit